MKKLFIICFSMLVSLSAYADMDVSNLLNKVTLQLQTEQWVTTKNALVFVDVNAAVADQGISNVQASVLDKLKQLSDKGDWHVMTFNRQLSQSGLESIQITAQARLPQTELSGLRNKAKTISKPGETYTINNVQFTPSEDETRQANAALRSNLYQQAKAEIDVLNKAYPDQKYYLYSMDFLNQTPIQPMANQMYAAKMEAAAPMMAGGSAIPIAVGNKIVQMATVIIVSMPDAMTQSLSHK